MHTSMSNVVRQPALAAALVGMLTCGTVMAQSNVTIYGILDNGIERVNNLPGASAQATRLTSGGQAGSRMGFRGTEDLGGGNKAFFALESGISMDTGSLQQGGRLFGRLAYVGIETQFGQLSLGRHRNAIFDVAIPFDPMVYNLYSVFSQDPVMGGRADNSLRYTKELGPLSVSGQYSFGYDGLIANGSEVPGRRKVGQEWGGSMVYTAGRLAAMLAYDERHGTSIATEADTDRRSVLAATYDMEKVKGFAGYRNLRSKTATATAKADLYWLGANYRFTPSFSLAGAVYRTNLKDSPRDATAYTLSALYNLSKRTLLYTNVGYTNNKAGSALGVGGPNTVVPGENQTGIVAGVMHRF